MILLAKQNKINSAPRLSSESIYPKEQTLLEKHRDSALHLSLKHAKSMILNNKDLRLKHPDWHRDATLSIPKYTQLETEITNDLITKWKIHDNRFERYHNE